MGECTPLNRNSEKARTDEKKTQRAEEEASKLAKAKVLSSNPQP